MLNEAVTADFDPGLQLLAVYMTIMLNSANRPILEVYVYLLQPRIQ